MISGVYQQYHRAGCKWERLGNQVILPERGGGVQLKIVLHVKRGSLCLVGLILVGACDCI